MMDYWDLRAKYYGRHRLMELHKKFAEKIEAVGRSSDALTIYHEKGYKYSVFLGEKLLGLYSPASDRLTLLTAPRLKDCPKYQVSEDVLEIDRSTQLTVNFMFVIDRDAYMEQLKEETD